MTQAQGIAEAWARLIAVTQDPLAPIKMQEAARRLEQLGMMLAAVSDKEKVMEISDNLNEHWTEEQLNEVSSTPEYIMALTGALIVSIQDYAKSFFREGDQ